MQHPYVNKKDFDQSLSELEITKKEWIDELEKNTALTLSFEWLRRVLMRDPRYRSKRVEDAIVETVEKAEIRRMERQLKQEQLFEEYDRSSNSK